VPCIVNSSLYCSGVSTCAFGVASCTRITSANTPEIAKKISAVTTYRTPMRLWSTVPKYPGIPGASSQTSRMSSGSGALGRGQRGGHLRPSRYADDRLHVVARDRRGRHERPRFVVPRVLDPALQIARRVLEGLGADTRARTKVREIRSEETVRAGAAHGVTARARIRRERELAARRELRLGHRCEVLFVCEPDRVLARRSGDDAEAHLGVLESAELGADPAIGAGLPHGEPQHVRLAGDDVLLPRELRHPEAVHDVVGLQTDLERLPDGHVDLVGGHDAGVRIGNAPPPLLADDVDPQRVLRRVAQRRAGVHGEERDKDEDQHGHDDAADPDEVVVVTRRAPSSGSRRRPRSDDTTMNPPTTRYTPTAIANMIHHTVARLWASDPPGASVDGGSAITAASPSNPARQRR